MSDLKDIDLDAFAWHLGAADRFMSGNNTQNAAISDKHQNESMAKLVPNRIDMEKLR
jgi:hypothetical protein